MPLIGSEALPLLDQDSAALDPYTAPLWQRPAALRILGHECDSWPRLAAGLGAWALGVAGAGGIAVSAWDGAGAGRVVAPIVGVALLLAAAVLGWRVWRSGRRVVDAFCWWTLLPERLASGGAGVPDWRSAPVRDAIEARLFMFQGWRLLRTGLASVAFLAPFAFLTLATGSGAGPDAAAGFWPEGQDASLTILVLVGGAVSWVAGAVTLGGQIRANTAQSGRDPVQRWLLKRR